MIELENETEYGQITFWSKKVQKEQMKFISETLSPPEKSSFYFIANKIANKAVKLKFKLDKPIKKKDMSTEMLEFRAVIMNRVIALGVAKQLGAIDHISPIIYNSLAC